MARQRQVSRTHATGVAALVGACLAVVAVGGCSEAQPPPLSSPVEEASLNAGAPLILDGVTVVNTRNGALLKNRTVMIANGRIESISPGGKRTADDTVQRVDARGKYLVPGFLDMHAHMAADWSDPSLNALLMLSQGTTGYRQMSGSLELLAQRAQDEIAPFPDAPALQVMPGDVLMGQIAKDPDDVRVEIQEQVAAGADFIKAVDLDRATYLAAIAEARRLGVPLAGHLPATISVTEASDAGMRAIEHLGPNSSIMLSCSSDEAALRAMIGERGEHGAPIFPDAVAWILQPVIKRVIQRVLANPILLNDEDGYTLTQRLVDTYDEGKCRALAKTLAATDMWQVPTLIRLRTMEIADAPEYRNDTRLKYVTGDKRSLWESVTAEFIEDVTPAQKETLRQFFELQMTLTGVLNDAGVKMLTGSDVGGGWIIPGFGLHQEFDLLGQAGASPLEVLQMATINGAVFLGKEDTMGTVEPGREANLVLLDANPLEDVQNLHAINAVVRNGNYYSRQALQDLIDER